MFTKYGHTRHIVLGGSNNPVFVQIWGIPFPLDGDSENVGFGTTDAIFFEL